MEIQRAPFGKIYDNVYGVYYLRYLRVVS